MPCCDSGDHSECLIQTQIGIILGAIFPRLHQIRNSYSQLVFSSIFRRSTILVFRNKRRFIAWRIAIRPREVVQHQLQPPRCSSEVASIDPSGWRQRLPVVPPPSHRIRSMRPLLRTSPVMAVGCKGWRCALHVLAQEDQGCSSHGSTAPLR